MPKKKMMENPELPQEESVLTPEVPMDLPVEKPKTKAVKRAAPKKKKKVAAVLAEAPLIAEQNDEIVSEAPADDFREEEAPAETAAEEKEEEEPAVASEEPDKSPEEEKTDSYALAEENAKPEPELEKEIEVEAIEEPTVVHRAVRPPQLKTEVRTETTAPTTTKTVVMAVALGATALGLSAALWFMTSRGTPIVKRSDTVANQQTPVPAATAAKLSVKSLSEGASLVVLPSSDPEKLSAFQLSSEGGAYSIEKLSFTVSNPEAFTDLTLINSGTQEVLGAASGPTQAINVFMLASPLTIPAGTPVEIELRAKVLAGHSGAIVTIALSANEGEFVGSAGSVSLTAMPELNASSASRMVREARPTLANAAIEKLEIKNGAAPVYRMTLGAEGGNVEIRKLTFRVDLKNVGGKTIVLSPAVRNASVRESGATNSFPGSSSLAGLYEKADGVATCSSADGKTADDKADDSCWLRVIFEPALIVKPGSQRIVDVRLNVDGIDAAGDGLGLMLVADESDARLVSGKFVRSSKTSTIGMIEDTFKLPVDNGTNEYELIWSDSGKVDGWTNGVGLVNPGLVRQEFTK